MVGFRRERNTASVPYRSNEMGVGFRDDVNYFNLDPITAGPQITSYLDFSNFVPSYVPPPPPPAPVYNPYNNDGDGGGDGNVDSGGGHYGGFDHQNHDAHDNEHGHSYGQGPSSSHGGETGNMGPGGGQGSNSPGDNGNDGGHASEGGSGGGHGGGGYGGDGPDWSHGGTIPPMYANQGMIATNDPYDYSDEQRARQQAAHDAKTKAGMDAMIAREHKEMMEEALLGQLTAPAQQAFNAIKGKVNQPAKTIAQKAVELAVTGATKSNPAGFVGGQIASSLMDGMSNQQIIDKANPLMNAQLYDAIYNSSNEYGYSPDELKAIEQAPSYGVNIGTIPNIDMTNPANYNIKDYVGIPEKYGAIPGNYSPSSSNITAISNPITGTPVYNSFVASTPEQFFADIQAELAAIAAETGSIAGNDGGGGWADGGFYNDDGTDLATNEYSGGNTPSTGDAIADAMNDTDQFGLSKGGHIYASQGGYVNSTGGK